MAALEIDNCGLAVDACGVRNLLAAEEQTRGKPYTPEERQKRVAELTSTLASIGTSADQEAHRLIDQGNVAGGQVKLDEAHDADAMQLANPVARMRRSGQLNRRQNMLVMNAT